MRHRTCARTLISTVLMLIIGVAPHVALSEDVDIQGINFKTGRPLVGDTLKDVVAEPSNDSLAILRQDADVLKEFPKLRMRIVGFTDNQECNGKACIDLSFRRAKYVRDWFISHGVSSQKLSGPEGLGGAQPIDNNALERGRSRNRRVELQVLTYPNGKPFSYPSD